METRTTIPLRWRDMDMLGHLNQSVYHELLEEARGGLIQQVAEAAQRATGADQAGAMLHHTYVVARVELDYRSEVRRDHGHVEVVVRVGRVGTKSVTLDHDVLVPDGTVAATGRSVLVGWDAKARGARELTDVERSILSGTPAAAP